MLGVYNNYLYIVTNTFLQLQVSKITTAINRLWIK